MQTNIIESAESIAIYTPRGIPVYSQTNNKKGLLQKLSFTDRIRRGYIRAYIPSNLFPIDSKKRVISILTLSLAFLIISQNIAIAEGEKPSYAENISYNKGRTISGNLNSLKFIDDNSLTMKDQDIINTEPTTIFESVNSGGGNWGAGYESPGFCNNPLYTCVDESPIPSDHDSNQTYIFYPATLPLVDRTVTFGFANIIGIPGGIGDASWITGFSTHLVMRINGSAPDLNISASVVWNTPSLSLLCDSFYFDRNDFINETYEWWVSPGSIGYPHLAVIDPSFPDFGGWTCGNKVWNETGDLTLSITCHFCNNTAFGGTRITWAGISVTYAENPERDFLEAEVSFSFAGKYTPLRIEIRCYSTSFAPYYLGIRNSTEINWVSPIDIYGNPWGYLCDSSSYENYYYNLTINDTINSNIYLRIRDNETNQGASLGGSLTFDLLKILITEDFFISSINLQWLVYAALVGGTLFGVAYLYYLWKKRRGD